MRKILRARLHHKAERTDGKTIKIFRHLWKEARTKQGHEYVHGEPVKKKSAIHRFIDNFRRK